MSNTAAVIPEAKACLQIQDRPILQPQGSEILVKNAAIATNPVDWKIQRPRLVHIEYPNKSSVSRKERVTGFATAISNQDPNHGAFQQYTLLNDNATARVPDSMSFKEGAILPMAIATAGVGIFLDLGIPRPTGTEKQSGGFLVWGASSSIGSAAVQIARSLGYAVYAVASPRHHSKTREYGASHVFDYNDSNVLVNIANTARGGLGARTAGRREAGDNASLPETAKKPDNVEISATLAPRINTDSKEFGTRLFNDFLERSLVDKTFVPSPAIEKVEGGIASVQKALDLHGRGLSGKKLVISLS
ncbi:MAG: hypothetical protein L6R42_003118 [Xanthoria sp. 1 TBL-2021]|nr:MAG: hypothetical protein L6R42_003118 [Xanthoria sp. 1 TBL-2021]